MWWSVENLHDLDSFICYAIYFLEKYTIIFCLQFEFKYKFLYNYLFS